MEAVAQAKAIKTLLVKGGIIKTEVLTSVAFYGRPDAEFIRVEAASGMLTKQVLPQALTILQARGIAAEMHYSGDFLQVART